MEHLCILHCSWHMTGKKQELEITFKLWGLGEDDDENKRRVE